MRPGRAALLLLFAGCFNPDDIFPLRGSLVSSDSIGPQPIRLLRESHGFRACGEYRPFKETTADEHGVFSFEVFRAQAQKLTGEPDLFCFRAETDFPSGSRAFVELGFVAETNLPPFPDWRAQPSIEGGVLRFEPIAANGAAHRVEWSTADGGLAWAANDRSSVLAGGEPDAAVQAFKLDEAVLEDFSGTLVMSGQVTSPAERLGPLESGGVTIEAVSGQTLSLAGTRVSISRGLPCPPLGDPCPLTDGALTPISVGGLSELTLELGRPVIVSAIVLRGLELEVNLVGGTLIGVDGGAIASQLVSLSGWRGLRFVAATDGGEELSIAYEPQFVVMSFDGGAPARSVTVSLPFNGGQSRIAELSVFE